jgi:O-acetyl-ADP-ribose deacetylase (regulator of RNase III)
MLELAKGNLLDADAEALVNTVNCVGVMGKGIALQFKNAFPDNFLAYERAVRHNDIRPGRMFVFETGRLYPKYIINFPTKRHWKGMARIEDIENGLEALTREVKKLGISSIAIPPLGCGNGGLRWSQVGPLIASSFTNLSQIRVLVFPPAGAPEADLMPVATKKPEMTRGRALLIRLIEQYAIPGYRLTLLEIQKLAYFLQVAGEALKLKFVKHKYGPYAENLNHVLQRMEGHYIRGYGDRSHQPVIRLLPGASEPAQQKLEQDSDANQRLSKLSRLIEGFETPYGMELLATVHWLSKEDPLVASDVNQAIARVHEWSSRKAVLFKSDHIRKAWERLHKEGWLSRA